MRSLMLAILLSSGCAASEPQLTRLEEETATAAGVELSIARQARAAGTSIDRLLATTEDYDEAPAAGIEISIEPTKGRTALASLRKKFEGTPYRAYLRDDGFGVAPDKIAVVQVDDLGYLGIVRTDGINHDIDHDKVLERYRQWHQKYGLQLVGAGRDWLEARMANPPTDWKAFAQEVHAFCPDLVEQGTGSVDALAKEMQDSNVLYLWWD